MNTPQYTFFNSIKHAMQHSTSKNVQKVQRIAIKHNHDCPVNLKIKGIKGHDVTGNTHLVIVFF